MGEHVVEEPEQAVAWHARVVRGGPQPPITGEQSQTSAGRQGQCKRVRQRQSQLLAPVSPCGFHLLGGQVGNYQTERKHGAASAVLQLPLVKQIRHDEPTRQSKGLA